MAEKEILSRKRARRSKGSQTETDDDDVSPCCQCKETLEAINVKLDAALKVAQEIQTLTNEIKSLKEKNTEFEETLEKIMKENQDLKADIRDFDDQYRDQRQDLCILEDKLNLLNARAVKLESHSRRNNLRFFNVPERNNESYEDAENIVKSFIKEKLGSEELSSSVQIERAHRVGRKHSDKIRPLIAKFATFKDKEAVRKLAFNLKGTRFGIGEDYAIEVLEVRKALIPIMIQAKKEGRKAVLKYDQLYIDGILYSGHEAHRPYILHKAFNEYK